MNVTFWYDFGSPNAWFAHHVIPGIEARTGATFTYVPVLLGGIFKATGNQAPFAAFSGVPSSTQYCSQAQGALGPNEPSSSALESSQQFMLPWGANLSVREVVKGTKTCSTSLNWSLVRS